MALPKVRFGEPIIKDDYNLYEIDFIKVYISNVLAARDDKIYLKFSSLFGLKNIEVFGFEIMR